MGVTAPPAAPYAIELAQISKSYGGQANGAAKFGLRDVSLQVPHGQIVGIIGPSGCGKTTFLRLLTGEHAPDPGGHMTVLGVNPAASTARLRSRIGYIPQHYLLSRQLTVWDTMHFVASLYGVPFKGRTEHFEEILSIVQLKRSDHGNKLPRQLSGGQLRRVAIACALVHDPDLIIADEPTAGLDPVTRQEVWKHFQDLRDRNPEKTFLIATQHIDELQYCDQVIIFNAGRLCLHATPTAFVRTAVGGDALIIEVPPPEMAKAWQTLGAVQCISDMRASTKHGGILYVTVEDRTQALPIIRTNLSQSGIQLVDVRRHIPSYDEAFTILTSTEYQARTRNGATPPTSTTHAV